MTGWRKASTCDSNTCVEWTKATACSADGNCAEVAILLRDSKNPDGPVLSFTPDEWRAFVAGVRAGEFDLEPQP